MGSKIVLTARHGNGWDTHVAQTAEGKFAAWGAARYPRNVRVCRPGRDCRQGGGAFIVGATHGSHEVHDRVLGLGTCGVEEDSAASVTREAGRLV